MNLFQRIMGHRLSAATSVATLLVAATAMFWAPPADAATQVTGTISSDTTWTTSGSPYQLSGNVIVGSQATLTVAPGVTVIGPYALSAVGVLSAVGTAADPIVFSISDGLRFFAGSLGSELAWTTIRDVSSYYAVSTQSGGAWPSIHDVEFRNNYVAMAAFSPSQSSVAITRARFIGNSQGIFLGGGDFHFDKILVNDVQNGLVPSYSSSVTITSSNLLPPTAAGGNSIRQDASPSSTASASPDLASSRWRARGGVRRVGRWDRTSGVRLVQLARKKRHPAKPRRFRRTIRATGRPVYVRVRDRAGNASKWRKIHR